MLIEGEEDSMTTAPNLPAPGPQSTEDRLQISRRFIIHAREELAKGHRLQAGEKAWGAAIQPLKAVAEQRGWKHFSNSALRDVGRQLVLEYYEYELTEALVETYLVGHQNFYENRYNEEELEAMLDKLEGILPALASLPDLPPRSMTIETGVQLKRLRSLTGRNDLEIGSKSDIGFSQKPWPGDETAGGGAGGGPNPSV